ncbi:hypothetical protein [Jannaschia pohangensis]|uniref:Uncharacterized protein n=1 Tax=Jannaschia pohangensis TaxID=390807 RepID=A0A1I3JFL8_9RHOB|nr:hypothetical protein [Jannaschia pohangensis]SFI59043.1 hypothetical protein SAMN04488095_1309 [Jannaschia pohangensis]
MARTLILVLGLTGLLAACGDKPEPGVAAGAIGVPPGNALFSSGRDARNFDTYADAFTTLDCRGLEASRAALRTQARERRPTTGIVANMAGTIIGGPAGALASVIGQEATQLVTASGNLRLAAIEAVTVAKRCDGPLDPAPPREPVPGPLPPRPIPVTQG